MKYPLKPAGITISSSVTDKHTTMPTTDIIANMSRSSGPFATKSRDRWTLKYKIIVSLSEKCGLYFPMLL